MLHAIDALRNAPADATEARLARIAELEKQPAEAPLAKAARANCLRTYELMEESAALQTKVEEGLEDPSVVPATLASDVLVAEAKLKESAASMPACEEAQAALRRAFP